MGREESLRIIEIACHRNGVGGAAFHVVLFEDGGDDGSRKVGIVFDEPGCCAVLDVSLLAANEIRSGRNSWRGDTYEGALREAIRRRFSTN